jgi:hypothetical protein
VVELLLKHGADIEFIEDEVRSANYDRIASIPLWDFLTSGTSCILNNCVLESFVAAGITLLLFWVVN